MYRSQFLNHLIKAVTVNFLGRLKGDIPDVLEALGIVGSCSLCLWFFKPVLKA
jgi:hypothetical protein